MSLYNDASLAMIPSAVKDGKLYSIRPTDGSGDFTFSRGSNLAATRVNVNGLIEKGRENLLLQSNQFDTTWTTTNVSVTSGQSDKDGGTNAWKITKGAFGAYIRQNISNSGVLAFSVYAKASTDSGDSDGIYMLINGNPDAWATFDLNNGTTSLGAGASIDSKIEDIGSGWYRCSLIGSGGVTDVRIYPTAEDGTYTATSGAVFIQDAQLEVGLVATDYIETTTTTAVSGITEDLPRLDYSGSCPSLLFEPTRTNSITQSEFFDDAQWNYNNAVIKTANAGISPEGFQNAYLITEEAVNGVHRLGRASWSQSIENTSVSVFAKSNGRKYIALGNANMSPSMTTWFDLENGVIGTQDANLISSNIEDFGNGWYRCSISYLPNKGNTYPIIYLSDADTVTSYQGDGVSGVYLYGYQIEVGASYPSSYIPTYGSAVTRNFDNCDLLNLVSKNIITDATEWTIMFNVDGLSTEYSTGDGQWFAGQNGTLDVYMRPNATTNLFARFYWRKDSKYIGGNYGKKIIARLSGGIGTVFVDGVLDGSSSIIGDYSGIGFDKTSNPAGAGYIKQILVFPTALTDSECIALTTL